MANRNEILWLFTQRGLKKVQGQVDKTESSMSSLNDKASKFGKFLTGAAIAAGVIQLGKLSIELANTAAIASDTQKAFVNLSKSAGISSKNILDSMREATRGTIADFELMQQFSTASLLGLPLDRFDEMLAIARGASKATGQSMEFMLNSIVTALGRGSKLMLDNLGILIDVGKANEEYAKSLGKTSTQLNDVERKQAFVNKALEIGNINLEKLGDLGDSDSDKFAAFTASMKNLAIAVGKELAPTFAALAEDITIVADKLTEMLDPEIIINPDLIASQKTLEAIASAQAENASKIAKAMAEPKEELSDLQKAILGVETSLGAVTLEAEKTKKAFEFTVGGFKEIKKEEEESLVTLLKRSDTLDEAFESQRKFNLMLGITGKTSKELVGTASELAEFRKGELELVPLILTEDQKQLAIKLDLLETEEKLAKIKLENITEGLAIAQQIGGELMALEDTQIKGKLAAIDKETEAKKEAARKRFGTDVKNAKKLNTALELIDQEADSRRKEASKKNKLLGIASVTVDTSIAIVKALAELGPIFGTIAGVVIAATGLAQISNIKSAALGTEFVTSGPELLLVGDNQGARERVTVEPLSSPNINGPKSGTVVHVVIDTLIGTQEFVDDSIIPSIQNAIQRGAELN